MEARRESATKSQHQEQERRKEAVAAYLIGEVGPTGWKTG